MDLSTAGDPNKMRRALMKVSEPLQFGAVPTYQAWIGGPYCVFLMLDEYNKKSE